MPTWTKWSSHSGSLTELSRRQFLHSESVVLNISQMRWHYCWTVENHWTKEDRRSTGPSHSHLSICIYTRTSSLTQEWRPDQSARFRGGGPGDDTPKLRTHGRDLPAPPVFSPAQTSSAPRSRWKPNLISGTRHTISVAALFLIISITLLERRQQCLFCFSLQLRPLLSSQGWLSLFSIWMQM